MLSEADTRAKHIDPAIHSRGWTEDLIRREETAGAVDIADSGPRRRSRDRVDYLLRVKVTLDYKQAAWLKKMPAGTAAVIQAIAGQFAKAGTAGSRTRRFSASLRPSGPGDLPRSNHWESRPKC
jgi:hypothetical protein